MIPKPPPATKSTTRPKAYSYIRFSTPEQQRGDSFRRQSQLAIAYAQKNDLDLDTGVTFHDLGTSAYRGKNAETGALKSFLQAVEDDHIKEGSYLLVESLDRISRASVVQAQALFMQIITSGITLVTLGDGREYSEERINANPTDFLISLIVMMRGNDESATKARRLKAAWANKRTQAETGKLMTKIVPGWVSVTTAGTLEAIPERAEVVRRIYRHFLEGMGKESIARLLNAESIPTWGTVNKNAAVHWQTSYITKILDNPAVLGTLVTRTTEVDRGREVVREAQRIGGYYPQIVDAETFARVRAIRDTATITRTKGTSPPRNILAGLSVCPGCGGSMIRVNKGATGKGGKPYLICSRAKAGAGCAYKSVGLDAVEAKMRQSFYELSEALLAEGSEDLAIEIDRLEATAGALDELLENTVSAIATQGASPILTRKLRELEDEKEITTSTIIEKRVQLFAHTHAMRRARIEELKPLLEGADVPKTNLALRELLRSVVVNYKTGFLECETKIGTRVDLMYHWVT